MILCQNFLNNVIFDMTQCAENQMDKARFKNFHFYSQK